MNSEQPFSGAENEPSEGAVIEAIKSKGIEDSEVMKMIGNWTIAEQERSGKSPVDSIMVEVDRAELFFKAGAMEEARTDLESALERVGQEKYADTPFKEECAKLENKILEKLGSLQ